MSRKPHVTWRQNRRVEARRVDETVVGVGGDREIHIRA